MADGNHRNRLLILCAFICLTLPAVAVRSQERAPADFEGRQLSVMHSISSHTLLDYVRELCSEKFHGRLTGTAGYDASAEWAAELFKRWKIAPAGDGGTYRQNFPNPYTLVLPGAEAVLHLPVEKGDTVRKHYQFEKDFFPGSTSDSGEVTAEVIYVGYGISAPELGYDEYAGLDVRGKLVLMEPEVPVSPDRDPEEFRRWRPYSFHDYKMRNAAEHGAAGVVYNYHIANPNCQFIKGLLLTYVGMPVVEDLFRGTGRKHAALLQEIRSAKKPVSFSMGKVMTIKNVTEHHPEGIGANIIAYIEGGDPELKKEAIIIGAHLDHLGYNHELMVGANDNASAVAVLLGVAEALKRLEIAYKRTIVFLLFGAEEQGVKGSEYYVANPVIPHKMVKGFINLESVGRGERIGGGAGRNYPALWEYFERANNKYIHRPLTPGATANLARPRQDAAHFMWAGIPTVSFGASGAPPLPYATYHTTRDRPEILTPEIMEDLARLVFLAVVDMAMN